LDEIMWLKN